MPDLPQTYGGLRSQLEDECVVHGMTRGELTVLGDDPYRMDTPMGHAKGRWFKEQVDRFVAPGQRIHLRGLHYRISSQNPPIKRPDGTPYINTDKIWIWLVDDAAKAARWLEYVPFWRIIDERNERPIPYLLEDYTNKVEGNVSVGSVIIPPALALIDAIAAEHPRPMQPRRIILIAEKSSLRSELAPVAAVVEGELLLPTGECSDTMIYEMCWRAAEDGRPALIFYFSDFDPAGNQMPVSVGRKVQALCTLRFHSLDIKLFPVALTLAQAIDYNLPSTPLKEGDTKGAKWRARYGREQTELDALLALHPGELQNIAYDAVAPFWDATLRDRCRQAAEAWQQQAQAKLEAGEGYQAACDILRQAHATLTSAIAAYGASREQASQLLPDIDREIEAPDPEFDDDSEEDPLFSSDDDFVEATEKFLARKALE
jgi:hypothetical protein